MQDIRGQGYDNGSDMRGDKAEAQTRIQILNSRALYAPCSSHSLNLVVSYMKKASVEAANFFNMVQGIFLESIFRQAILSKYFQGLTLKPLDGTKWQTRIKVLKSLRFHIRDVYDALLSVYENQEPDNLKKDQASGLLNCIKQFKFLCSISKPMQTKDYDLASAFEHIQDCKKFFKDLRSEKSFDETIVDARKMADEIEFATNFDSTIPRHPVIRKKTTSYTKHEMNRSKIPNLI